jgi:hypothetical protein
VDGLRSSPLGARVLVLDGAALLLRGRRWSRAKPAGAACLQPTEQELGL